MDSLSSFRNPQSVAVVGASANAAKWGYWLAKGAMKGADRRIVGLVNRTESPIDGARTVSSLSGLGFTPELVVLCVPGADVTPAVDEAIGIGSRSFLTITADVPDEKALIERVQGAGARIIGPNSLGLYDASSDLQLAWGHFSPGSMAVISQSGQLGSEIAGLGKRAGIGISRFVSVGNQPDVRAAELLSDLVSHEQTKVVVLYLEDFADGPQVIGAIRELVAVGKRVLVLCAGASAASQRVALSHTGSVTSSIDLVEAACRAAGAVLVSTPAEAVDAAVAVDARAAVRGPRVGIVSDSGGQGAVASDVAARLGLDVVALTDQLQQLVRAELPDKAAISNPIDLAGAGERDLFAYARVCGALLDSGEVDAVLLSGYFGSYGADTAALAGDEESVVAELIASVTRSNVPLVVHAMDPATSSAETLRRGAIPVYGEVERALRGIAAAATLHARRGRTLEMCDVSDEMPPAPGYMTARQIILDHGIAMPNAIEVVDAVAMRDQVAELKPPFALKAAWLAHKTEVGGVRLGLGDDNAVEEALRAMQERLGPGGYIVEEQDCAPDVVEIVIAAGRDRDFGPTVTVGLGGVQTELWNDVAIELAPVDLPTAHAMLARLRSWPLLTGWRGKQAVDIDAAAKAVVALSRLIASRPGLAEVELNPVRISPLGAIAVDVLMVPSRKGNDG